MGISPGSSIVSLPEIDGPTPTLIEFLSARFPHVSKNIWLQRIETGKILTEGGNPVTLNTPYAPNTRLFYFREVEDEPSIPFKEKIIFISDHLIVVCKPHFLPVTPSGPYVLETVINRIKEKTGNPSISPINRIDRETAGLVLLSSNKETRGCYQQLFMEGRVQKTYEAVVHYQNASEKREWLVENRIETAKPWFLMKCCPGQTNARSKLKLVRSNGAKALFTLSPLTGKKHQLRVHLSDLGFPIVNDRYYPQLLPEKSLDFDHPLQLLSKKIEFRDPISGCKLAFESDRPLQTF
ncbi:pseudouridine synthase [Desulforhopalus sp. IMCC35007]|uniref:pseudouridine synthase n=1 Tax=Desulforhopalus sp. IMCC35007 TaxID=2569543 RepID=UPI0010AE6876|nr:pseudouridine synthase [Desulforhopalus sp. IMCC35007]TKB05886.1 pseudouridine synthase [Desulforhopalus sp. IMCC35007]